MSRFAISLDRVGKLYNLGRRERYGSLRDTIARTFSLPFRRSTQRHAAAVGAEDMGASQASTIWALKDVSLDIEHGAVLGVIGRNGAGKSTLLKILSRITEPTIGRAEVWGRVGSLLEVGTGFHPELTGRENVYLNGAILGMRKAEITAKFDEIVAFAEVEKFLDTPVKHYSTGMYLRLAFAVAAHLESEILFIDEVLAVGDASFQKKCLGKMGDVTKKGRTVLFVSHNMSAVRQLCERVIWIDEGRIREIGDPASVITSYLLGQQNGMTARVWEDAARAPGDEYARLRAVRFRNSNGEACSRVDVRLPFDIDIEYDILAPISNFRIGFRLATADGIVVFTSADVYDCSIDAKPIARGSYVSSCRVTGDLLNEGNYSILNVWADIPFVKVLFMAENPLSLYVEQTGGVSGRFGEKWSGVICPDLKWSRTARG